MVQAVKSKSQALAVPVLAKDLARLIIDSLLLLVVVVHNLRVSKDSNKLTRSRFSRIEVQQPPVLGKITAAKEPNPSIRCFTTSTIGCSVSAVGGVAINPGGHISNDFRHLTETIYLGSTSFASFELCCLPVPVLLS